MSYDFYLEISNMKQVNQNMQNLGFLLCEENMDKKYDELQDKSVSCISHVTFTMANVQSF